MKIITIILLSFITSTYAAEYCPIQSQGDAIAKLAKELEAACDWSFQKLAKEKIIKDCTTAKKKDSSIRFRSENGEKSLHFSQYGDTYNYNEPNVECKHNKAYKLRLDQLTRQYTQEAQKAQREQPRKTGPSNRGRTGGSTPPPPPPRAESPKQWRCKIPNYIRTFKTVGEAEKAAIENAHGNVCIEYRP